MASGPLEGVRVLDLGGIGPGPYATMLMADLGADVIRVDRPGEVRTLVGDPRRETLRRNKRSIVLDLRNPAAVDVVKRLAPHIDVMVEGWRPGVAERLGVGPEDIWKINARVIYGRVTGWGQTGPLAHHAGHDIDYIALTGALHAIGRPGEPPAIPANILGDFAAGGAFLVIGALAALVERERSGRGQVVDAAIVDGAAHLFTQLYWMLDIGLWKDEPGVNILDGGAPYYNTYRTKDLNYLAVGAIESQFYARFLKTLGADIDPKDQFVVDTWPTTWNVIAEIIEQRTLDEWLAAFDGVDACVAPVLTLSDARLHPHLVARQTFEASGDDRAPAPAPRFSRTPGSVTRPPAGIGEHTAEILSEFGIEHSTLLESGAAQQKTPHDT